MGKFNYHSKFIATSKLLLLLGGLTIFFTNSTNLLIEAFPHKITTPKTGNSPILFVVDASGSMVELFSGVPRMVAARVMLSEQLKRIDPKTPVGLVAYGNRIAGCRSHRIYSPIRTKNRKGLLEQIRKLYPAGATPIANTLKLIGRNLLPYHPGATVIIISDGAESCGGDPVREAQKLMRKGYDIKLNVIGLSVDRITAIQLGAIARVGKGQYFDVNSQTGFADAVAMSTHDSIPVTKPIVPVKKPVIKSDAMLNITKVYQGQGAHGEMNWHVKYNFKTIRTGRYLVNIKALTKSVHPGPGGKLPGDKRLLASRADSFYEVKAGTGELVIPQDKSNETGKAHEPFFFQGELWDTSSIPVHLYISKAVRAE